MGGICSKAEVDAVDRQLMEQQMASLWDFKILVLGSGESGKSTVVKQIRLVHKGKMFSEDELQRFREALHDNVVDCCKAFCGAVKKFGMEFDDEQDLAVASMFLEADDRHLVLTPELGTKIIRLWKSKTVQNVMAMRDKFWVSVHLCWRNLFMNIACRSWTQSIGSSTTWRDSLSTIMSPPKRIVSWPEFEQRAWSRPSSINPMLILRMSNKRS